jgi:hypothetical protein
VGRSRRRSLEEIEGFYILGLYNFVSMPFFKLTFGMLGRRKEWRAPAWTVHEFGGLLITRLWGRQMEHVRIDRTRDNDIKTLKYA